MNEAYLRGLTAAQADAATREGPVLVLAGAGTVGEMTTGIRVAFGDTAGRPASARFAASAHDSCGPSRSRGVAVQLRHPQRRGQRVCSRDRETAALAMARAALYQLAR